MRVALVLAGFLAACAADEPAPAWLVGEPRVMAIHADPPAVRPNGTTRLGALVTDGVEPGVRVEGRWRACAPWVQLRNPDLDCGPEQSVELPVDESGHAVMSIPDVADALGIPVPEVDPAQHPCDVETLVSVPVVYEAQVGDRRLVAIKEVPVANAEGRNPAIAALLLDGEPHGLGAARYRPGQEHTLEVSVDHASLDLVCGRDSNLDLERVRVYVYVSGGDLDDSRLDVEHDLSGNETAERATWTAPADGDPVIFWLIATERGGRPGIGWTVRLLEAD